MRFSYCEELIEKKSFFIYTKEYLFNDPFSSILLQRYGLNKFFYFFSFMLLEFHNSIFSYNVSFVNIGLEKSKNLAQNFLGFFNPNLNIKDFFFYNIARYEKISNFDGKNLICGLPKRGQRTHSNKKSSRRFHIYSEKYITSLIPDNRRFRSKKPKKEEPKRIEKKIKIKKILKLKGAKKIKKKKFDV